MDNFSPPLNKPISKQTSKAKPKKIRAVRPLRETWASYPQVIHRLSTGYPHRKKTVLVRTKGSFQKPTPKLSTI